jgi:AraC family transcriptional regulator
MFSIQLSRVLQPVIDDCALHGALSWTDSRSGPRPARQLLDEPPRRAHKAGHMLRKLTGACVRRVIDPSHAHIPEHAHDWPVLSIFVLGRYSNQTELGETVISGPSAVLYRAGATHRNIAGPTGFEQIEIEFDPAWLGPSLIPDAPVSRWLCGRTAAEARMLARLCGQVVEEECLRAALQRFLQRAGSQTARETQGWVDKVSRRLGENTSLRVGDLAEEMRRHPSWLGTAYRHATGEGLLETAARLRLERATRLLRETDQSAACIALEAGFCDQSHMNRTFRRMLGRLPSEIRADRSDFRRIDAGKSSILTRRLDEVGSGFPAFTDSLIFCPKAAKKQAPVTLCPTGEIQDSRHAQSSDFSKALRGRSGNDEKI